MKRDRKISIFVVLLVVLFTAFFLYEASFLVINGDFTRFFPWGEGSDTYYGGEEGQTPILAMEREEGEVLTDYIISRLGGGEGLSIHFNHVCAGSIREYLES